MNQVAKDLGFGGINEEVISKKRYRAHGIVDGKSLKESYDDWEESGIYGGDLTYCPICDTRLKYDEDGDHYCPKCKEDAHSLSMKRRHLSESVDYREIADQIREHSDEYAILVGWQYKNEPYVEIYPEEHSKESLENRINRIKRSYDRYSFKGNTGHRYAKDIDFKFDVLYKK